MSDRPAQRRSILDVDGSQVFLEPGFLAEAEADVLMAILLTSVPWSNHPVRMFGRCIPAPRLSCWMGDSDAEYRYSGIRRAPEPWQPPLLALRDRLKAESGAGSGMTSFNSVLLNLYRNGSDYMGWHADDEPELGPEPLIASLSLGATRDFLLRPRPPTTADQRPVVQLGHGDLLWMRGRVQRDWQHSLPKRRRVLQPRINLTWRTVFVPRDHKLIGSAPSSPQNPCVTFAR